MRLTMKQIIKFLKKMSGKRLRVYTLHNSKKKQ